MSRRDIVELVAFQAVWLTCALGAASGSGAPGVAAAALFVAAQIILRGPRSAVAAMTLVGGVAGLAMETLLLTADVVGYAAHWPDARLAPAWIVGLWLAFGSTLSTTARLLGTDKWAFLATLGAIFGPLAYLAGARLGALHLSDPEWLSLAAIAFCWGVMLPALVALVRPSREPEPG